MKAFTLRMPVPPPVNNLFFNARRGKRGGPGRLHTSRYQHWIAEARLEIFNQTRGVVPNINFAVNLTLSFSFSSKADLDNLAKAPIDLLVSTGILADDSKRIVRRIVLEWGDHPGCLATIAAFP